MRDLGKGRKVVDIDRRVIRVEDMDEETLQQIMTAEPGERSKARGHLMDEEVLREILAAEIPADAEALNHLMDDKED